MEEYRFRDECLSRRDVAGPKPTPRAMATLKESKKMPMPWKIEDRYISVPWNLVSVLQRAVRPIPNIHHVFGDTYSYKTILTASLSKLSPKMTLYSLRSTLYC